MKSFCYPYDAKIILYKAFYRVLNHLTYNITMHFSNLFNHGAKAPRKASDKAHITHLYAFVKQVDRQHIALPECFHATIGQTFHIGQILMSSHEGGKRRQVAVGRRHLIDMADGALCANRTKIALKCLTCLLRHLLLEIIAK